MECIWTERGLYKRVGYRKEAHLETAILQVADSLFGPSRIYLDVKKKIGAKGGKRNIPDGYLIDLSGSKPRLYVVENELAAHDPLRHMAVQILQFSLSFEAEPRTVKRILLDALHAQPRARERCEEYAKSNDFRNLDHLLEWLVFEGPFAALVIIDEIPEDLESVLARKFQFGVEVLQLSRYQNSEGETVFHFEPFLADLSEPTTPRSRVLEAIPQPLRQSTSILWSFLPARTDSRRSFLAKTVGMRSEYTVQCAHRSSTWLSTGWPRSQLLRT